MPRAKYLGPPGPFRSADQIRRVAFRFTDQQREELTRLLPARISQTSLPAEPAELVPVIAAQFPHRQTTDLTLADLAIADTEGQIGAYLTSERAMASGAPLTPARERAAIKQLQYALKPFIAGWLSRETCDLVPDDLPEKLARQDKELAKMPARPAAVNRRNALLGGLGLVLEAVGLAGDHRDRAAALKFVARVLELAEIKHPADKPSRLAALVFPKQ